MFSFFASMLSSPERRRITIHPQQLVGATNLLMDTVYALEDLADLYDKEGIPGSDELRAEAAEGRAEALQGLPEAEVVPREYVRLSRSKA